MLSCVALCVGSNSAHFKQEQHRIEWCAAEKENSLDFLCALRVLYIRGLLPYKRCVQQTSYLLEGKRELKPKSTIALGKNLWAYALTTALISNCSQVQDSFSHIKSAPVISQPAIHFSHSKLEPDKSQPAEQSN